MGGQFELTQYQYNGEWYSRRELESICNTLESRIIDDIKFYGVCYGKNDYYMVHDGKLFRIVKIQFDRLGRYVVVNKERYHV